MWVGEIDNCYFVYGHFRLFSHQIILLADVFVSVRFRKLNLACGDKICENKKQLYLRLFTITHLKQR